VAAGWTAGEPVVDVGLPGVADGCVALPQPGQERDGRGQLAADRRDLAIAGGMVGRGLLPEPTQVVPGGEAAHETPVVGGGDGGDRVVDPAFEECEVFVAGGKGAAGDEYRAQPCCGFARMESVQQRMFERAGVLGEVGQQGTGCGWLQPFEHACGIVVGRRRVNHGARPTLRPWTTALLRSVKGSGKSCRALRTAIH
jgi:hypothetical protein